MWCVTAVFGALPGLGLFLPCSRPGPEVGHGDERGTAGEMVLGGCVGAGSTATSTSVVKQRSLGKISAQAPARWGQSRCPSAQCPVMPGGDNEKRAKAGNKGKTVGWDTWGQVGWALFYHRSILFFPIFFFFYSSLFFSYL